MIILDKKKLLILGANPETANLVRTAQRMGIYTIVTDYLPNSYAKKIADKAYDIDGLDIEGLIKLVRRENINGVLVGIADPLIFSYYKVCKELNLPCYITEEALDIFTNKRRFKSACKMFGICGVPEYTLEEIIEDKNISYPVLIKPVDGRSGKGMSVCYFKDEIDAAIEKALKDSRCKQFLIERYMECDDVFMYYTFVNGKFYLSAMPDRFTCEEQKDTAPVVLGAVYPSKYIELYENTLHKKMCELFQYLKIKNGVLLIQAFVENGKFYVYDPGFRLQGGAPHILINNVNGFDHQEMLINFALTGKMGEENIQEKNDYFFKGKIAASQTILLRKGIIKYIEGIDRVQKFPEIVSVTQRLFEGDEVSAIGTEQQILVRFHIVCDTKDSLRQIIEKINNIVHVFDIEGNEMKLGGLSPNWI